MHFTELFQQHPMLSFRDYMQLALYHPQLGYYQNSQPIFGAQGDFVTAPELSVLFCDCVAQQCVKIFNQLSEANILEFGAGSGIMAAHVLLALEKMQQLPQHYYIIEVSQHLKNRQRQTLQEKAPHLLSRVQWLDTVPENFVGIILANEVLDAMPVHRFLCNAQGNFEYYVKLDNQQQLQWVLDKPSTPQLHAWLDAFRQKYPALYTANGYTTEVNLQAGTWLKQIADHLQQGSVLLIDYGYPEETYYHPQRHQGTLRCHYQHQAHDNPLLYPGKQDITAHVNFTAIAEQAQTLGLEVLHYGNQAEFLFENGLMDFYPGYAQDAKTEYALAQQVKRLTLPSEMGELFKVLHLGRGCDMYHT
jgi:SAM-dependent MidA family methyltransferase